MVLGPLEMVIFNVSISFDIQFEIQFQGGLGLMVLKLACGDLERKVNRKQKVFVWMRCSGFAGRGRVNDLQLEVFHMKEHGFGFIVDSYNKKRKGFSEFVDDNFKRFSGINWSVSSIGDWSVSGNRNKCVCWLFSQRV